MKLFLCGGGSGNQIKFALNKFSSCIDRSKPILYIPLAMDEDKYDSCKEWFSSEIKLIGIKNFDMVKSSLELSKKNFKNYCALFIGGGNTYKLLKDIKNNLNFEKIKEYLNNDGIVFGGSAGAIIFGKSINGCLLDDGNYVGLKDCNGFNYLNDYSILCHLNSQNFKKNNNHLIEFSKNNKTIYLPEEDTIIISDKKISFIGQKKYIIFDNGKFVKHNFANMKKDINK
ncbi:MAG TPA: Type 1 glutamine amidotransferase-like domain-containing protein [Candidatus Aphodocola excrementigallinarum]|uniref:Type 1 glutamine amidotransferase-like domain-containing protein n=1 Tax=Candidatus Aphodocola excrementigallinarum TaxID=2840670 RepID=A0A9D1LIZ2_9FIRM|nr:Type 1 glutamine amidotransferase-like domain-containing protein [Candidatus Aphodocola excrementigallinarum]